MLLVSFLIILTITLHAATVDKYDDTVDLCNQIEKGDFDLLNEKCVSYNSNIEVLKKKFNKFDAEKDNKAKKELFKDYVKMYRKSASLTNGINRQLDKYISNHLQDTPIKYLANIQFIFSHKGYIPSSKTIQLVEEKKIKLSPTGQAKIKHYNQQKQFEIKNRKRAIREETEKKKHATEERKNILKAPTGIWKTRTYVDKFRESTSNRYITTASRLTGVFSNTATHNSQLDVALIIDSPSKISIMLFEYGGNNPVQRSYDTEYSLHLRDRYKKIISLNNKTSLSGTMNHDRLVFIDQTARLIHRTLLKGGKINFYIENDARPSSQYFFTILDADGYGNAYNKFLLRK